MGRPDARAGPPLLYWPSVQALAAVLASPLDVVTEGMVHRWGVLALCLAWLWLKREALRTAMAEGPPRWPYLALGVAYLAVSPVLFPPGALLLGALGVFAMLFGRAALLPSALLGIYSFAVLFPLVLEQDLAGPLAAATAAPAAALLHTLGYPLLSNGVDLRFIALPGDLILVTVTAACAGPATLALFIALFGLMMLDVRLPWREAAALFCVGLAGTWLQSVVRVVTLLLVGYYQGAGALAVAHEFGGYVLFSLWYLAFAAIYLRRAQTALGPARRAGSTGV